jgi:hypothetical protein
MDLGALTDRPAVPRFLQRICLDFEREGVNFNHDPNMMAPCLER